jgi:molybdopterin-guanine dinucleotide biosynthesis protein A
VVHRGTQEDAAARARVGPERHLDHVAERVTGLVLCGGASSRMGRDKATLDLAGTTLIERALRSVSAVASDVRLACGPNERYAKLGVPLVRDRFEGAGPLSGIEAGLHAAPPGRVVVLACDMPRVDARVLARLLDHARDRDLDVVTLRSERGLEPLCGVWSTRVAPLVSAALARGELGVHDLIETLPRRGALEVGADGEAVNVNTPADLERERASIRATSLSQEGPRP